MFNPEERSLTASALASDRHPDNERTLARAPPYIRSNLPLDIDDRAKTK
jgi:hypothetical protein